MEGRRKKLYAGSILKPKEDIIMYKKTSVNFVKSSIAIALVAAFALLGSVSGVKNSGLTERSEAANLSAVHTASPNVLLADDWDTIDFI